ncbi:unnamed protein product [Adineta steineri]|uniref:Uncharacterized protein n=1 Tax=Adineta steineri TaxID=433720 RepID=A0A819WIP8_9BILA|nr:unnamed protein product [Adineta steineri]
MYQNVNIKVHCVLENYNEVLQINMCSQNRAHEMFLIKKDYLNEDGNLEGDVIGSLVEDDNCLRLSSLQRAFPGCTGLYHHSDNENDIIFVPNNNNGCLQCEWNYEITYHPYYPGNIEGTQPTSEFYVYCILLDTRPNSPTSSSSSFFRQLCVTAAGK